MDKQEENKLNLIKTGLYNYLGTIVDESPYDTKGKKQHAVSITMEQIMKLCKEDDKVDFFALKPLFRVCKGLFITYGEATPIISEREDCKRAVKLIDDILSKLK